MKFKRLLAGVILPACIFALLADGSASDDPIDRVIGQFNAWSSAHPHEKVYLQLDRPHYSIGDTLWFKAYVTIGSQHKLSALSGVLNVELISDRDSVKQSIKLPVISGLTWGDMVLPDTLKEGNYRVRAYTNWMRNAGSDFFFDKAISISNAISNVFTRATYSYAKHGNRQDVNANINYAGLDGKPFTAAPVSYTISLYDKQILSGKGVTDDNGNLSIDFTNPSPDVPGSGRIVTSITPPGKKPVEKSVLIKALSANTDIQFFPEGGSLVTGNNTRIAFKGVGADGLGVDIKGVVVDDAGNRITTFASRHLGMGVFTLDPENGKHYKTMVTYADGSESVIDLPKPVKAGYSLSIDNSDEKYMRVKILPGPTVSAASSANETVMLIAQSGGTIYFAGKSQPGSKSFTANVPREKFPTGVAQFTLFSSAGEPLNERLVFIQNHDQLTLEAAANQQVFSPRQKVQISLTASSNSSPVAGSFSVSVINETKVPVDQDSENTIISNLLLTADIKGYVEKPGYYFNDENDQEHADLDLLMLTQGYHRFEWKQILAGNSPPPHFQPEKTLEISGHLKNLLGKPVANGKVTLFSAQGGLFMIDTVSDNKGNFTFKNLVFKDSVRFVVQARTAGNHKNVEVTIDQVKPAPAGNSKMAAGFMVNYDSGLPFFLQSSKIQYDNEIKYGLINNSIMLKEVVVRDEKKEAIKNSSNLNRPGNADQVVLNDDDMLSGCANIAGCLQGRLLGVVFRNDTPYLTTSRRPMQIVLDGSYVDASVLSSLNGGNVGSVEVLRNIQYTAIYGGRGSAGVLVITSKTGDSGLDYQRYSPGIISYMPRGYAKVREFYSPKYDDPKTNAIIPDLRSTIFWKPNIVTGKDGKASFSYFNADEKGTYRVEIEGIDAQGRIGRTVYRYKVE